MGKLEAIEKEIEKLSGDELARFRAWFAEYDAANWDRQVEADIGSGRLDSLLEDAMADHKTGKSREL